MGRNSPETLHTMIEAKKIAWADRAKFYADPAFTKTPLAGLLSKNYATERRKLIDPNHALLQAAHVPGPYVFAAHSFGGIFARLYASTYPNDVVGMVLVDALSEKVRTSLTPERWKLYVDFGFTKPTPGLEKYKDIETLDVNASLDQMEKAGSTEPLRPMAEREAAFTMTVQEATPYLRSSTAPSARMMLPLPVVVSTTMRSTVAAPR